MRILLTGSSGFIGSSLIPHLKSRGDLLVGFDRRPPRSADLDVSVEADLLDDVALGRALEGVEMVMHLAAAKGDWGVSEERYFRDNVEATRRLIQAGGKAGVKKWIFYSTVATLGPSDTPLDESAPFSPLIPYGASKAESERLFSGLARGDPETQILIIRPSAVFGPGDPGTSNIHRLIEAIHRGRFVMVGQGKQVKTTSYIENLIAANLFLAETMTPGLSTYIYVDQPAMSTDQLVSRLYRLLGKRRPSWYLPVSIARPIAGLGDLAAAVTGRDLPITAARVKKFCTATNFDPTAVFDAGFHQPVSNEDALRAAVEWYLGRARDHSG